MKMIMFNDRYGLTKAVLEGRKTMTRRVCKEYQTGTEILAREVLSWRYYPEENLVEFVMKDGSIKVAVPPYKNNEVVAVAQRYSTLAWDARLYEKMKAECDGGLPQYHLKGWTNKMFVKAELMPHRIKITDMSIERLQDISEEDCLKEGVCNFDYGFYVPYLYRIPTRGVEYSFRIPREAFAALIDRPGVGRKGLWWGNPMVFVYEFEMEG